MADTERGPSQPRRNETSDGEQQRVRSSNDRDQQAEREGIETEHNQGYDDAVEGRGADDVEGADIDPDSADSDVDRDDTIDKV